MRTEPPVVIVSPICGLVLADILVAVVVVLVLVQKILLNRNKLLITGRPRRWWARFLVVWQNNSPDGVIRGFFFDVRRGWSQVWTRRWMDRR